MIFPNKTGAYLGGGPTFLASASYYCWSPAQAPLKPPYGWRHADLKGIRDFLKAEIARGAYKPILPGEL